MDLTAEEIRRHGVEELEELRTRVGYWKEDFLSQAPAGGGQEWEFLVREFHAEIDEYVYPYLRRMIETEHVTAQQAAEFMDFCYCQVLEVADHLEITQGASKEGSSRESIPLIYK
ncbi:MAG: hypothetical protein ACOZFS_04355 [Thermodesulfobacteriota bacterium]